MLTAGILIKTAETIFCKYIYNFVMIVGRLGHIISKSKIFYPILFYGLAGIFFGLNILILLLLGGLVGFILQRSNFCFASGLMNFFMFGKTKFLRALILLLILSSAGFLIYALFGEEFFSLSPFSQTAISPGLHTVLGGFLFGLGMTLAGSCVVGMLFRIGEGSVTFILVLAGVLIGSSLGSLHSGWWQELLAAEAIYLPGLLGWPTAAVIQFGLLAGLYIFLSDRKK